MLFFKGNTLEKICSHAQCEYPKECCGIMLGRKADGQRSVYKIIQTANVVGEPENRKHFRISSFETIKAELIAEQRQLEIVGFYHSHPEYDAIPSKEDTLHMISGYSYPIISVEKGKTVTVNSFEKISQTDAEAQKENWIKEKGNEDFNICIRNTASLCK